MASIFEEMMSANHRLTESAKPSTRLGKKKVESKSRKISYKNLKIESRKFFEDNDLDDIEKDFEIPEEDNQDQFVLVIDPEVPAEDELPEDAAADMIGDKVYKCPVCGSNYVCSCDEDGMMEDMEVDADGAPVECPICGDDADQILIGEITPAEDAGDETVLPPQEVDDAEDNEEFSDELDEVPEEEEVTEETEDEVKDESVSRQIQEDLDEDEVVNEISDTCDGDSGCALDPALPTEEVVEDKEVDKAPAVEVKDSTVTLVLDDPRFESMMNQMIRENYKGGTFEVSQVRFNRAKSQLKIEYVVRNGKKSSKGTLVGEGFNKSAKRMKISFKDKGVFTESFAETPSFVVECVVRNRKVVPVKMSYDYKVTVNESLYRVAGKVK